MKEVAYYSPNNQSIINKGEIGWNEPIAQNKWYFQNN